MHEDTRELLALEAGVLALLHEVARHERDLRAGRVSVRQVWRMLYAVSDLAAMSLLLSAAVRDCRDSGEEDL